MDYSKRENTNRRLLSGNYGEKLYSRVWIYALRIMCVCFLAVCFAGAGALLGTFMGMMDGVPEITLDALHFTGETSRIVDKDGNQVVEAEVPMGEMTTYLIDLRSMTQGRGSYQFKFTRYEMAPEAVQNKIIEEAKANADE